MASVDRQGPRIPRRTREALSSHLQLDEDGDGLLEHLGLVPRPLRRGEQVPDFVVWEGRSRVSEGDGVGLVMVTFEGMDG